LKTAPPAPIAAKILLRRGSPQKIEADSGKKLLIKIIYKNKPDRFENLPGCGALISVIIYGVKIYLYIGVLFFIIN